MAKVKSNEVNYSEKLDRAKREAEMFPLNSYYSAMVAGYTYMVDKTETNKEEAITKLSNEIKNWGKLMSNHKTASELLEKVQSGE